MHNDFKIERLTIKGSELVEKNLEKSVLTFTARDIADIKNYIHNAVVSLEEKYIEPTVAVMNEELYTMLSMELSCEDNISVEIWIENVYGIKVVVHHPYIKGIGVW